MQKIILLALLVFAACGTPVKNNQKSSEFTNSEISIGSNTLMAIIDYPSDTKDLQAELKVRPQDARILMQAIHPYWDMALDDFSDKSMEDIRDATTTCEKNCSCNFYQAALDKHPVMTARGANVPRSSFKKDELLKCVSAQKISQRLLMRLKVDAKAYQSESIY